MSIGGIFPRLNEKAITANQTQKQLGPDFSEAWEGSAVVKQRLLLIAYSLLLGDRVFH